MAEETVQTDIGGEDPGVVRIYEVGYTVVPTVKEEDLEGVVGKVRGEIEKLGGNFIAEGAPASLKLAYEFSPRNAVTEKGGRKMLFDRAYFGWIKFEAKAGAAHALEEALKHNKDILRSIAFETVREDTRAKMKAPTLREVRRTDTIKSAPRRTETEEKAPVSEVDLEKALEDITTE
ncbi:hypothetical protein C4585_01765 [Candidatus Parcubacteria bacterium]|nr:MAG: hypothetical protein C4585_01765 [Candidatus Parcubacteria bacterium]